MAVSRCLSLDQESMRTEDLYAKIAAFNGRCVSYKNGATNVQVDLMGCSLDVLPEAVKQEYIGLRNWIVTTCDAVINHMQHVINEGMQAQIDCNKFERNFMDCVTSGKERIHSQQKLHEHVTVMHKNNFAFEQSLVMLADQINTTCRQIFGDITAAQMKATTSSSTDMDRNLCVTKLNQLKKDTQLLQKCMQAVEQKKPYQPEASVTSEKSEEEEQKACASLTTTQQESEPEASVTSEKSEEEKQKACASLTTT